MAIKLNAETFAYLVKKAQEELSIVLGTLKERGSNRFGRTFAVGGLAVFFSYYFVYTPPYKKMRALQRQIDTAKATAQYADQYKELRDKLNGLYAQMPPVSSRDRWLTQAVLDSMKAENIMSDSIVPPDEQEANGFVLQKLTVSIQLKFSEMMSWLNRVESTKPLLHVNSLDMLKRTEPLGVNGVNVEIGTIIPAHKAGQE